MINLLSSQAKKTLMKEYLIRVSILVLWALLIIQVLTLVFFIPTYFVLSLSTNKLASDFEQKKAQLLSTTENKESSAQLAIIKKEMALLKIPDGVSGTNSSELVTQVLNAKPRGVEVSGFTYENVKGRVGIQISGVASSRENLLAFRKTLTANANIAEVKFGTSFITKKTDIDFIIIISFR